jgi:hypothetical protein
VRARHRACRHRHEGEEDAEEIGYPVLIKAAASGGRGMKVAGDTKPLGEPEERPRDVPLIEQIKIQAQVLVPLVKTLRAELGEGRAHALVHQALRDVYRQYGEKWWRAQGERDLGEKMAAAFEGFATGDALDYELLKQTADACEINVTRCRYAEFYHKIGAPELGFLLVCGADFTMAEGYGAGVELARTQTIMEGASHCDFRYRLKTGQKNDR